MSLLTFLLHVCDCIAVCSSNYDRNSSLLSVNGSMSSSKRSDVIGYIILFIISGRFRLIEMESLARASAIIFSKRCKTHDPTHRSLACSFPSVTCPLLSFALVEGELHKQPLGALGMPVSLWRCHS